MSRIGGGSLLAGGGGAVARPPKFDSPLAREKARCLADGVLRRTRVMRDDERVGFVRDLAVAVHELADAIEALERS